MKRLSIEERYIACLDELYLSSTPSVSFKTLFETATINEEGKKIIPYNEHSLKADVFDIILKKHSLRIRNKEVRKKFEFDIMLGPSPKRVF